MVTRLWQDTGAHPGGRGTARGRLQVYLPTADKGSTQKLLCLFWHLELLRQPDVAIEQSRTAPSATAPLGTTTAGAPGDR